MLLSKGFEVEMYTGTTQGDIVGFSILPIQKILRQGNEAQQWLQLHKQGHNSRSVIVQAIENMAQQEIELEDKVSCANFLSMKA
jgi:gamma-glutamyl:cysteine ligase YbdK (ATP-grasp superfamily)